MRDHDFELIGLSREEFASFDQTRINDFIQKYTDPKYSCQVYKAVVQGKRVVVIEVPEFAEVPIICKADANSSKDGGKLLLRKGQIYMRTDKGTSEGVSSSQEMRELLGRAIAKTGDSLLHSIERLLKGKPSAVGDQSLEKYQKEIEEADVFIGKSIGDELKKSGSWKICVYPNEYQPTRIADHKTIKDLIAKSEVELRGWNFPHTDKEKSTNFLNGRQSHTSYFPAQNSVFVRVRPPTTGHAREQMPDGRTVGHEAH